MKIVRLFIAISISMSIVSCAAMFNGTTKQISIRSNEEDTNALRERSIHREEFWCECS